MICLPLCLLFCLEYFGYSRVGIWERWLSFAIPNTTFRDISRKCEYCGLAIIRPLGFDIKWSLIESTKSECDKLWHKISMPSSVCTGCSNFSKSWSISSTSFTSFPSIMAEFLLTSQPSTPFEFWTFWSDSFMAMHHSTTWIMIY